MEHRRQGEVEAPADGESSCELSTVSRGEDRGLGALLHRPPAPGDAAPGRQPPGATPSDAAPPRRLPLSQPPRHCSRPPKLQVPRRPLGDTTPASRLRQSASQEPSAGRVRTASPPSPPSVGSAECRAQCKKETDRSDEMKKILNKFAASVGLQLPDFYQP